MTLTYRIEANTKREAVEIVESNNCPEPIDRALDWDGEPDEFCNIYKAEMKGITGEEDNG